jgi:hypothetical protein
VFRPIGRASRWERKRTANDLSGGNNRGRWAPERTLAVYDSARMLAREIGATIDEREIAGRIESAATVSAIVSSARSDRAHARSSEDFDADAWLLNTPAGTIDLRAGGLRPHCRADGLAKVTPVAPTTLSLIAFLQRLCGYWGWRRRTRCRTVLRPGRKSIERTSHRLYGLIARRHISPQSLRIGAGRIRRRCNPSPLSLPTRETRPI